MSSVRCTAASGGARGVDSTVVLAVGCGAVLQYPAALEVKLVEEQYGPCKSDLPKVLYVYIKTVDFWGGG